MSRLIRNCLLVLLGHFLANYASADVYGSGWYRQLELAAGHEDNVNRAFAGGDVKQDQVVRSSLGLGYAQNYGDNIRYVLSGYISYNYHPGFDALSNFGVSLGASGTWQPHPGYESIWVTAGAEVTRLDYRNSEARNGYLLKGNLGLNRRFGLRTIGHFGYRYADLAFFEKSEAEKQRDAAFDVARHEIYVGVDHEVMRKVYLLAEYSWQHGGFTSSVNGTPAASVVYEAETEDKAFQYCDGMRCTSFYAYRAVADLQSINLGVAFNLGGLDYDVSARYFDAKGEGGTHYRDWTMQVGLIWTF
ncbi:MAG: hypothetical protein KDI19_07490 [Pseudomonadales bacterium]|nr:hypothetical protein [Pseudomonadales bacterium]